MRTRGFTLIELMIVVAIVGILAAIAIPNFARFQAKSKQGEAKVTLKALYSAAKARFAERGDYGNATANSVFTDLSWQPDSMNRYMYVYGAATWTIRATNSTIGTGGTTTTCAVGTSNVTAPNASTPGFTAQACSNIDGDTFVDTWMLNDKNILFNGTITSSTITLPPNEDGNDVAL